MGRPADVVFGIEVPDYISNRDVYAACDAAVETMKEHHVDVSDIVINGLEPDPFSATSPDPGEGI